MSRLLRAFTEMIEGNSKVAPRKSTDAEPLKKSEFKTLIQKELTTSKKVMGLGGGGRRRERRRKKTVGVLELSQLSLFADISLPS
uniref:Uncharacterized protein n=1 Tax=Laticauda laticaudata TaxID=8630 RepID=A0A8C5STY2_LATLA